MIPALLEALLRALGWMLLAGLVFLVAHLYYQRRAVKRWDAFRNKRGVS